MARFSLNKLPEKERIRLIGEFYDAMSLVKNRDEAAKVFRDLLDGDEIGNIMRRLDVAILLILGFTYDEIIDLLGVGKDKVARVQRKINRGGEGFHLLVHRILERRKKRKIKYLKLQRKKMRQMTSYEFERLKKKYPLHFLFSHIIDEFGDRFEAKLKIKGDITEAQEFYQKHKRKRRTTK